MARIRPASDAAERYGAMFAAIERGSGYVPTSLHALAHRPEILDAFTALFRAVMGPGLVDPALKQLAAQVASTSAGCRYCQAHTATAAHHAGVPDETVAALFDFETSDRFGEAERAALRLARDAGVSPSAATDAHFAALRAHFTEPQIAELMAAIALFGFLNRWNDAVATDLEDVPRRFAERHLARGGWEPGKHGRADAHA